QCGRAVTKSGGGAGGSPARSSLARRHVAVGLGEVLAGEELVHLGLEELAVLGVHHVQPALVDQHGLVRLPFVPGLLRHVVVDVLALGAGVGRAIEAGQVLVVLAAVDGTAHDSSPAFSASAARLRSFFTGAARPRRGGLARLYQSQSPSAMTGLACSTRTSQGSMASWTWLKVWVSLASSRRSPTRRACRLASGSRAPMSSSSGRLHRPPHRPLEGRR